MLSVSIFTFSILNTSFNFESPKRFRTATLEGVNKIWFEPLFNLQIIESYYTLAIISAICVHAIYNQ